MYITADAISELERSYGAPVEVALAYEMTAREFEMVRGSQKHGRSHDVTLFILCDDQVVVISKPMYPLGAYRAPSGGIAPGESIEVGAIREAREETGLIIQLTSYVLRAKVRFTCDGQVIDWTTHVFSARPTGGVLAPIDTREIVEARLATVAELRGSIRDALLRSGSTGLRYRAELTDLVVEQLFARGLLERVDT
jgi:8-oxo-dGTP pyrophosphatase MutT (NUDIX family)